MSVDTEEGGKKLNELTLKEMAAKWLFTQGASTVLLFVILLGVWYGLPQHLQLVQQGYDKNAGQLKEATAPLAASVDKLSEKIDKVIDELRTHK